MIFLQREKLYNGVYLNDIHDFKFKTTSLMACIHMPLDRQQAAKNALLPLVLKRGSAAYPTFSDIEQTLAYLCGASFQSFVLKKGDDQILCFSISMLSDRYSPNGEKIFQPACRLLFDVLLHPCLENGVFRKAYVEAEKQNLIDMIESMVNDKQSYALWRCYEVMCEGEPFGISEMGDVDAVRAIDENSLYEQYQRVLSESVIDFFVCGQADMEDFKTVAKAAFAGMERADASYPDNRLFCGNPQQKKVTDQFAATNQAKLSLGFTTSISDRDEAFFALQVANSIFGSGTHSKLFNNVREKLSLAYYAFSRIERRKGLMLVGMGIEEANYQLAFDETIKQLDNLKNGDVSDYEYESAKASLINQARSFQDSQLSMIDFALNQILKGSDLTIKEYCDRIAQVTLEQAVAAAKQIRLDTIYLLTNKKN